MASNVISNAFVCCSSWSFSVLNAYSDDNNKKSIQNSVLL